MSKTGIVKYYVTTDTHSYPWGIRNGVNGATVHFDLGDNTAGFRKNYAEAPEVMSVASQIALRGNHDTAALGWNKNTKVNGAYALKLQVYRDNTNKIIFFGLDTGTDDVNVLEIPLRQIDQMAQTLSTLPLNWDVVVLTHTPLFPKTVGGDVDWDCGACWGGLSGAYESSVTKLLDLLQKFKKHSSSFSYVASDGKTYSFESSNGYVIGCFAGHIFFILRAQERRDAKQDEREQNYQKIIEELTQKLHIITDMREDIEKIRDTVTTHSSDTVGQ